MYFGSFNKGEPIGLGKEEFDCTGVGNKKDEH